MRRFVAEVLPQNRKMISVFTDAGYEVSHHYEDGVIAAVLHHHPDRAVAGRVHGPRAPRRVGQHARGPLSRVGRGGRREPAGRLDRPPAPARTSSPAASPGRSTRSTPRPRRCSGPAGPRPVGDIGRTRSTWRSIAVPAESVLEVVRDCAGAGVRALLVVSAGFAEAGPEGEERQRELLRTARSNGMRVIGPNSFGIINSDPACGSTPRSPRRCRRPAGSACSPSAGPSASRCWPRPPAATSASRSSPRAGNRVDVSGNDFMQYWIDDDDTTAVGLYLESMGNPRKFSRIARHLATTKPVIVVKSGVSSYGVPPGHRARADAGAAGRVRRDAAPGRGDPGRERPPALRRRPAGRAPAAAAGQPGGDRRQLRRAGRADRRGVRQLGPGGHPRAGVAVRARRRQSDAAAPCRRPSPTSASTASSPASSRRWCTLDEEVATAVAEAAAESSGSPARRRSSACAG